MQQSAIATLPNPFILLDLDPFAAWNQAAFDRALQVKRAAWSRAQAVPGPVGEMARERLPLLDSVRRALADAGRRQTLIMEAQEHWTEWTAAREAFEARLAAATTKDFLLESERRGLVAAFGPVLGELDVTMRIAEALASDAGDIDDAEWRDVQLQTWTVHPSLAAGNGEHADAADVYRAPLPRDVPVAEPPPARTVRWHAPTRTVPSRVPVLAGLGGVAALAVVIAAVLFFVRGGGSNHAAVVPATSTPATAARIVGTPTPRQQQTLVEAAVQTRYSRWMASLGCPCDRGLDTVEGDPILRNNLHTMSKAQQAGGRWTITLRHAHVDWVQLEPPNSARLQLSANDRRVFSVGGVQKQCYDGPYQDVYALSLEHGAWMVRTRHTVQAQPSCSGPTPATQVTSADSPQHAVLRFLRVWDEAFGANDVSQLSTVVAEPLLGKLQSTVLDDRALAIAYKTAELSPPTFSNLAVNGTQATVLVARRVHVQPIDTTTGQPKPGDTGRNTPLNKTYTLIKLRNGWIVSNRQP